jgi:hypothetical protein
VGWACIGVSGNCEGRRGREDMAATERGDGLCWTNYHTIGETEGYDDQ